MNKPGQYRRRGSNERGDRTRTTNACGASNERFKSIVCAGAFHHACFGIACSYAYPCAQRISLQFCIAAPYRHRWPARRYTGKFTQISSSIVKRKCQSSWNMEAWKWMIVSQLEIPVDRYKTNLSLQNAQFVWFNITIYPRLSIDGGEKVRFHFQIILQSVREFDLISHQFVPKMKR